MTSLIGAIGSSLRNRTPVSYAPSRLPIPFLHANNPTAQMRAMGAVGTLFAIVHRTSNATAQVEWRLYRRAASGKEEDRTEVTRHAALDLWNRPNPFFPRQLYVESVQQHLDLTGEGWWVLSYNPAMRSLPLEMWPVRPDRIAPIPHPEEFISGYLYTAPSGERIPLERREVIQLKMPNPLDPYRGMGPVQALLADLDSAKYSAEWNRNFFFNSAQPGGIIEVEKTLQDHEFEQLRTRWNEQHKGVAAAHRVAILEHGKYNPTQFSMRDMQFVELRNVTRDTIMEAFGIDRHMLGITEDVNRANAEAAEVVFARYLTVSRLERWKGALNHELLPLFGADGLEFDYLSPVPDDREGDNAERTSKANAVKTLIDAGFDPVDVLEMYGMPALGFTKKSVPSVPIPVEAVTNGWKTYTATGAAGH